MSSNPELAALPAVVALAEREARDRLPKWIETTPGMTLSGIARRMQSAALARELALLSDLTRPASRDALARLVAGAVGLPVAAGVYFSWDGCHTDWGGRMWMLHTDGASHWFTSERPHQEAWAWSAIAGVSAITDPAEALTLIALHILGAPHG